MEVQILSSAPEGSLAQLVERFAYIEDVAGSSPAGSTYGIIYSSLGSSVPPKADRVRAHDPKLKIAEVAQW